MSVASKHGELRAVACPSLVLRRFAPSSKVLLAAADFSYCSRLSKTRPRRRQYFTVRDGADAPTTRLPLFCAELYLALQLHFPVGARRSMNRIARNTGRTEVKFFRAQHTERTNKSGMPVEGYDAPFAHTNLCNCLILPSDVVGICVLGVKDKCTQTWMEWVYHRDQSHDHELQTLSGKVNAAGARTKLQTRLLERTYVDVSLCVHVTK